jgi:hypothetical protein
MGVPARDARGKVWPGMAGRPDASPRDEFHASMGELTPRRPAPSRGALRPALPNRHTVREAAGGAG